MRHSARYDHFAKARDPARQAHDEATSSMEARIDELEKEKE
jgi:hypothetical protein